MENEKNIETINKEYRYSCVCTNADKIGVFADNGYMYVVKINDIIKTQMKRAVNKKKSSGSIIGKLSDKGVQIFEFCNMEGNENILYMDCLEHIVDKNLVFLCSTGNAKLVSGDTFNVTRKNIAAYKLDDDVVFVSKVENNDFLVVKSKNGVFSRIPISELPVKGKGASCSKAIHCAKGDSVDCATVGTTKDYIEFNDTRISFTKVKLVKKGEKGSKLRI